VSENQRLSHDLDTANTGLTRALDEVDKLKGHRDRQAATLTRALDLLKAFTATTALSPTHQAYLASNPACLAPYEEAKAFLKEMMPNSPWSDDWNQHQEKLREERLDRVEGVINEAVERAATISPEPEPPNRHDGSAAANDFEIPSFWSAVKAEGEADALWVAKEGGTYCVYVKKKGQLCGKPAASGEIAVSMAQALYAAPYRDREAHLAEMTGTEMIEMTASGNWYPVDGQDTTVKEKVAKIKERIEARKAEAAAPPNYDSDDARAARIQAVRDQIASYLEQHPRTDRAQDEELARAIRQELLDKNIATVRITALKQMIADQVPLPRGRKAKVQAADQTRPATDTPPAEAATEQQEPPAASGKDDGDCQPRYGQKRIVGLCSGTWYPLDLFDDLPGPVERYGIEVFRGTEANRDGEYVRVSKEFATRQEAEYLLA
jgi:hypothetical protein